MVVGHLVGVEHTVQLMYRFVARWVCVMLLLLMERMLLLLLHRGMICLLKLLLLLLRRHLMQLLQWSGHLGVGLLIAEIRRDKIKAGRIKAGIVSQ